MDNINNISIKNLENFKNEIKKMLQVVQDGFEEKLNNGEFKKLKSEMTISPFKGKKYYNKDKKNELFNILRRNGNEYIENYRIDLIVHCLLHNLEEIFSDKYPTCVREQFMVHVQRIYNRCVDHKGWGESNSDVFWKDLAIARQEMFPAGSAQVVEMFSGFGLRQGLGKNLKQSVEFLMLVVQLGGRRGYYQVHTHTPEFGGFSEEGWNDCYVRIANMMKKNPYIKGICNESWFYDPQLAGISPRLMYLQTIPLQNGAKRFYLGLRDPSDAIAKSKTRENLYKEGRYTPKSFMIIWPRKEFLQWAEDQSALRSSSLIYPKQSSEASCKT